MAPSLAEHYDAMWRGAEKALVANAPELDPHLRDKAHDLRRGATLLIRPAPAVAQRVAAVLADLAAGEPEQYYYRPEELHVTVLSLFTGTVQPEPYLAELPRYRRAIAPVFAAAERFVLHFDGLTASPAAILVQGYPDGAGLYDLREALRAAIHAVGLGHNLDQRYRISTAHMTAARFCRPLHDSRRLAEALRALRRCDFGVTQAAEIQLVTNDWYMSHDRIQGLETYQLGA